MEPIRRVQSTIRVSLPSVLLLLVSTILIATPAPAQDPVVDVQFHNSDVRIAIASLAEKLEKTVAFDRDVSEKRSISFQARSVTKADALTQLLQQEKLYTIELGPVIIIAPDTDAARANYTPERIEACRIDGGTGEGTISCCQILASRKVYSCWRRRMVV